MLTEEESRIIANSINRLNQIIESFSHTTEMDEVMLQKLAIIERDFLQNKLTKNENLKDSLR